MKNKVKTHRVICGMTQQNLAEKVGVSRQTIISIEKGSYNPSVQLALKIAHVLQSSVHELFELEESDWSPS
jgi:putative transcriptional regulator